MSLKIDQYQVFLKQSLVPLYWTSPSHSPRIGGASGEMAQPMSNAHPSSPRYFTFISHHMGLKGQVPQIKDRSQSHAGVLVRVTFGLGGRQNVNQSNLMLADCCENRKSGQKDDPK